LSNSIDKGISDILGVFTDPILVFPGGWGDTLPGWLKEAITTERLMENMKALRGGELTGTDAEACAYLMTVSLTQPMDHDWTEIYLYVATKVYARWRESEIPDDNRVESLRDEQLKELSRLKDWIYRQRIKMRLERDRAERREKKEQEAARRKTEQPVGAYPSLPGNAP
jgi:hypothetical protein